MTKAEAYCQAHDLGPETRRRIHCTWCAGSGKWVERRQVVPCTACDGERVRSYVVVGGERVYL